MNVKSFLQKVFIGGCFFLSISLQSIDSSSSNAEQQHKFNEIVEKASKIEDLKKAVAAARCKAALTINNEFILLYYAIGKYILESRADPGSSTKVIEKLSEALQSTFPGVKGFSRQNLKYMRKFADEYTLDAITEEGINQLPWGHIVTLIYAIVDRTERRFYIQGTIQNGWSRNTLFTHIKANLFKQQGEAVANSHAASPGDSPEGVHGEKETQSY